ncbi:MAG: dTDP-4-dehydrorhamnose reductase [Thermoleophilia bacterium]|jgi:dTDP-4-dehydrorhamnose reductase|nr:dTDP-4-dehydrorhamnose reductase [Thermoleophilia bacterium]
MRTLVTGARGMLGRDLVSHLEARGDEVTAIDLEVDVTDQAAIAPVVAEARPEVVFHLAAFTDVDGAETREAAALAVNQAGCANVARAARAAGASLVVVSTDYVFSGEAEAGYAEDDPPGPRSAYGRTKLAGERAALAAHPDGTRICRTAWLYGRGGRNFVETMLTLSATRDEVRVVADQVGCPTWTGDLVPALIRCAALPPGIFHTAGGGQTSWAGFAEAIFAQAGRPTRVVAITTEELDPPRPAPRPRRSVLRVTRPGAPRLRDWSLALGDYLKERERA